MIKINLITTICSVILFIFSLPAFAVDLKEFQERCEAYGAQPGTTLFFTCMRDLDQANQKKNAYENALKECNEVSGNSIFMQGYAASNERDSGSLLAAGNAALAEFPTKCKNAAYRRIFGAQQSTGSTCIRSKDGNRLVCEDKY